jgi:hypothetical protein
MNDPASLIAFMTLSTANVVTAIHNMQLIAQFI